PQRDAIGAARLLTASSGQRPGTRRAGAAEVELQRPESHRGELGEVLVLQCETEVSRVEGSRPLHVRDEVAYPVKAGDRGGRHTAACGASTSRTRSWSTS